MNANKLAGGKAIRFFLSGVSVTIGRSYACDSKGIPLSRVFLFMICKIFGCRAILVYYFFSFFYRTVGLFYCWKFEDCDQSLPNDNSGWGKGNVAQNKDNFTGSTEGKLCHMKRGL